MAKNPPDERLVYLALKPLFKGADAQLRKSKKIREIVQRHAHHRDVRNLIQEHNLDNVCNVAKALLEQQIFESTLKAKIRFPEVFEVSPAQSAEREASEAEAAKTEADAIKDAAEGRQSSLPSAVGDEKEILKKGKERRISIQDSTSQPQKHSLPNASVSVSPLYPVYLPLQTQHRLLVKVQDILEKACYKFGQRTLEEDLQKEGWDCAEAVELNLWSKVILRNQDKFATDEIDELGKPLPKLLDSIAHLRHTAVHRVRVTMNRIEQFMVDSESLAKLLQDDTCVQTLSQLRRETQLTMDELKHNKDLLESRLAERLKEIAAQRAELERLEHTAVEDMLRDDREYQALAGANLEQAILSPDTIVQSVATTAKETGSEVDIDRSRKGGTDTTDQGRGREQTWTLYECAAGGISKSHEKVVQMLLAKGADVNAQGGEYGNALQAASNEGDEKVVQMLLDKGAEEVNAQGGQYGNALQAASNRGDEKVVQMLRKRQHSTTSEIQI